MTARVLWPARESLKDLMRLRATIGPAAFEAEKQGNPRDPSLLEWPDSYFDWPGFWYDEWPETIIARILALDPSKGNDRKPGDYSAFGKLAQAQSGIVYVEADLRRDRDAARIAADGAAHVKAFKPDVFCVEANGFQELLFLPLSIAGEREQVHMPLAPIENYAVPKEVRIRRITSWLHQKRLRFRANSPGTMLLVKQLREFPVADHDDGPDMLEMGLRTLGELMLGRKGK